MNVLVIASRFPWPAFTGDRMRTLIWLDALDPHARVALVAPPGEAAALPAGLQYFEASPRRSASPAWQILRRGLPLQSILAAPFHWREAIAAADRACGPFDATVVILSRVDPWIRASLPEGCRVLDAVDSLRRNAAERAAAARPPLRSVWKHEERRQRRLEKELASVYDHVVVVSDSEREDFGQRAVAIGNGVRIHPLDRHASRDIDVAFWGRLPYFANSDAVQWFLDEIAPLIRREIADARIVIGGADATRSIRVAAQRAAVELESPIADVASFARRVRVALFPVRFGSGQSNKVLEAAEAGCGIVSTSRAARGLEPLADRAVIHDDAASMARATVTLLRDAAALERMSSELRRVAESDYARDVVHAAMRNVVGITERRA